MAPSFFPPAPSKNQYHPATPWKIHIAKVMVVFGSDDIFRSAGN